MTDPSDSQIRVCGYDAWKLNFFDDHQIYRDALLIAPMRAGRQGGRERSFSCSIAQFIPRQVLQSASLHSKGEGSALQSHESWIYLVLKEELQLDEYCGCAKCYSMSAI